MNRLTQYEPGWLAFLVKAGLASKAEAREAMDRVAQDAFDELQRRRRKNRRKNRRKPKD